MSRKGEERRLQGELQREKEKKIIKVSIQAVEKEQTILEVETGTKIMAAIQQTGNPVVRSFWQPEKTPTKCFWDSQKAHEEKINIRLKEVNDRFMAICIKHGISPLAKITPNGAQVFYEFTETKRKEIIAVKEKVKEA